VVLNLYFLQDAKMADCITLIVIHAVLVCFLVKSIFECVRAKQRRRKDSRITADLKVERGEQSMEALCYAFGVVSLAYSLAISASDCNCIAGYSIAGYKATFIIADYIILSYLFFLNSWFRNSIVFKFVGRVRTD